MKSASRASTAGSTRFLDLVTAAFVTVLVVSNVASSAKIVDWGIGLFGVRLAFDAGTLLFPVSYVFGDLLTEVYGYRRSRRVIWTGFACLAVSSLVLWIVRILPGEAGWEAGVGQAAYV
ncbi:MAG TPA: VUT family protein, partial [Bryobacteraceae bacterium]|nr:VUT family protein [Bryobacteraceae bacterium]